MKTHRAMAGFTIETAAAKADITERYLYRIENEGKVPGFEVMCRLVSVLSIPGDNVFYPPGAIKDPETEGLVHMLYSCDKKSRRIAKAVLKAILENQQAEPK